MNNLNTSQRTPRERSRKELPQRVPRGCMQSGLSRVCACDTMHLEAMSYAHYIAVMSEIVSSLPAKHR